MMPTTSSDRSAGKETNGCRVSQERVDLNGCEAFRRWWSDVNPGLINPWLIHRRVSPFSGDSSLLEGTPP